MWLQQIWLMVEQFSPHFNSFHQTPLRPHLISVYISERHTRYTDGGRLGKHFQTLCLPQRRCVAAYKCWKELFVQQMPQLIR